MHINCLPLLYIAFQHCRHGLPETEKVLEIVEPLSGAAQAARNLLVELRADSIHAFREAYQPRIAQYASHADAAPATLAPAGAQLFNLCRLGVQEAMRLIAADQLNALRALGYALHPIPALVPTSQKFDPKDWMFCLGILANEWRCYSSSFQHACCNLVALRPDDVAP